jgi:hypothetical protein
MVYRGRKYPGLQGVYLYGDYCSGRIRGLRDEGGIFSNTVLVDTPFVISAFGEDESGNLYVADYISGSIYRIIDTVAEIPAPTGQETFVFPAVDSPVVGTDPAQLNPFGFGPFASGGDTIQFQVALAPFDAAVDVYIGYSVSTDPDSIFILGPDLLFGTFTVEEAQQVVEGTPVAGIEPWKADAALPIDVNPVTLPAADLTPGAYTVYLLVTPSGRLDSYYLAQTSFVIP